MVILPFQVWFCCLSLLHLNLPPCVFYQAASPSHASDPQQAGQCAAPRAPDPHPGRARETSSCSCPPTQHSSLLA